MMTSSDNYLFLILIIKELKILLKKLTQLIKCSNYEEKF
jgi:hypothetical protein